MQLNFFEVLIDVGVLIGLCIPGLILKKLKWIPEYGVSVLVVVLLYVAQPFLTISSLQKTLFSQDMLVSIGIVFGLAFVIQILTVLLVKLIYYKSKLPIERKGVYQFASVFSNCGFMGIPVLKVLCPHNPEMILYAAIYILSFNVLNWTLGVYLLTGNVKNISIKKALLNPPTIALVVAAPLFFLNIRLVDFSPALSNAVNLLSDMTTPLSMTILGIRLADIPLRRLVTDGYCYLTSAVKLLIAPLLLFLITMPMGLDPVLRAAIVLLTGMPSAATVVAFADKFGADSYTAATALLQCSVLSIICIPIVAMIL